MRAAIILLVACGLAGCGTASPAKEIAPSAAIAANWPAIPPGAKFGQVSAVDVDARGRVFVLHRAGREWREPFPAEPIPEPTVFVFDGPSGRLLARWAAGQFVMPHGLSIDLDGKVWITDVGLEQVFRFSADGELELTLGERGVSGDDRRHFGRPTDIAFSRGEVLISDGYLNHRVAVFDQEGRFLRQWGRKGAGARGLDIPHAIAVDRDFVYVADRENGRIQTRDSRGKLHANWSGGKARGHPYSMKPLGDGRVISVEGRDSSDRSGAILRIWSPEGRVEQSFDAGLPGDSASLGHDIAVAPDGMVYLADVYGDRVVKLDLGLGGTR